MNFVEKAVDFRYKDGEDGGFDVEREEET